MNAPTDSPAQAAPSVPAARRTGWALAALYALVAFEFFYMVTPFAAFFYAVLRPGLELLGRAPGGAWLASFFLPHYAETRSPLVEAREPVGLVLFLGGLAVFAFAAAQVYWAKLRQRGAVTGGLYRVLRHPQYAALMVSGFGMVLVWPRYLVLALFVSMVFVYRALADLEEAECAARFGDGYRAYAARTRRFLPLPVRPTRPPPPPAAPGPAGLARGLLRWAAALAAALVVARAAQRGALAALSLRETEAATWVSVARMDGARLAAVAAAAERDPDVRARLAAARARGAALLVYVLPEGGWVSEVPMRRPPGVECHALPADGPDRGHVLVVTEVRLDGRAPASGAELLRRAVGRTPLFEVRLDAADRAVGVDAPLEETRYDGSPVPVV